MNNAGSMEEATLVIRHQYFNGFELSSSLSDMSATLMIDGQPQFRIAFSFTTAKTLAKALAEAVTKFEEATGKDLLTMGDVEEAYQKSAK